MSQVLIAECLELETAEPGLSPALLATHDVAGPGRDLAEVATLLIVPD